jgi:hypothetical protein
MRTSDCFNPTAEPDAPSPDCFRSASSTSTLPSQHFFPSFLVPLPEPSHVKIHSNSAPTQLGQTPLHLAAALGQTSTVSVLLKHGAEKEAQDDGGLTALHGACENGRTATVDLLLRNEAEKEARDKVCGGAFSHSCKQGGL